MLSDHVRAPSKTEREGISCALTGEPNGPSMHHRRVLMLGDRELIAIVIGPRPSEVWTLTHDATRGYWVIRSVGEPTVEPRLEDSDAPTA
jgi:hypothetical protein